MKRLLAKSFSVIVLALVVAWSLAAGACSKPEPTATPVPPKPAATSAPAPTASQAAAKPAPTAAPAATATQAAAKPTAAPAPATKTVKFGILHALSGGGAGFGLPTYNAARVAVDDINGKGGLKVGNDRYMIELVAYDDEMKPDKSVSLVNKLVFEDKVSFILGSTGSATTDAIQAITEPNKVIINPVSYAKQSVSPKNYYTFRSILTSYEHTRALYPLLRQQNPNLKTVAIIYANDAGGWSGAEDSKSAAAASGFQVVTVEFAERGLKDYYPLLTKVLAKNPDAIDHGNTVPADAGLLLKQLRELGYKGKTLSPSFRDPSIIVPIAGAAAMEGDLTPSADFDSDLATPEMKAFRDRYTAKFKRFDPFGGSTYDMLPSIAKGIEKAGTLDTTAVVKALESMGTFDAIMGPSHFGGADYYGIAHQIVQPDYISQFVGGKLVLRAKINIEMK